jgi:hypothetical protein
MEIDSISVNSKKMEEQIENNRLYEVIQEIQIETKIKILKQPLNTPRISAKPIDNPNVDIENQR